MRKKELVEKRFSDQKGTEYYGKELGRLVGTLVCRYKEGYLCIEMRTKKVCVFYDEGAGFLRVQDSGIWEYSQLNNFFLHYIILLFPFPFLLFLPVYPFHSLSRT